MSKRIVICSDPQAAAEFCRAEDQLKNYRGEKGENGRGGAARSGNGRGGAARSENRRGGNRRGGNKRGGNGRSERGWSGRVEKNYRRRVPAQRMRQQPKEKRRDDDRARRVQEIRENREHGKAPPHPPVYDGKLLIGDSILKRFSREMGLYAPKRMPLCQGGNLLKDLLKGLEQGPNFSTPSAVVMIGTNNVLQGKEIQSDELRTLITVMKSKGIEEEIYFLTIPPLEGKMNVSPINAIIKNLEDPSENIFVVDVFASFMDGNKRREDLFEKYYYNQKPDLVHPNKAGLRLIKKSIDDFALTKMSTETSV